ncbi:unnamed protein product [Phyllotreta striolata]|uniref:Elongator complex protein 5 n=1 Tax=Phyllotreta striolata TaxID=444603 RepID=A0A9N9TNU1_PHYSR|nr:unnamed protein product [Phyllotreta striolata]
MLKNYLTAFPPTKFVIIEDTVNERGEQFVEYLLNNHSDKPQTSVHYFVFQEPFARAKARLAHKPVNLYDYVSNPSGWNGEEKMDFANAIKRVCEVNGAIFIDSLVHVIYSLGLGETYALFNALRKCGVQQQIVTVLHKDLLDVSVNASQLFRNLSTLFLNILPESQSDKRNNRVEYVYIKPGGKVFKEIEEYCFQIKGNLVTKKIEKLDPKKLVSSQLDPELLATFKIGLSTEERQIRDERRGEILPYLPKSDDPKEGRITYKFDETDDWDEEDPDDDLDI